MITFKIADTKEDIIAIAKLAKKIYQEHYIPIIGTEQVDYMLEKFQSEDSIKNQIDNKHTYLSVYKDNDLAGYSAFTKEEDRLFLSKFYLDKEYRGLGIGRKMLEEVMLFSQGLT